MHPHAPAPRTGVTRTAAAIPAALTLLAAVAVGGLAGGTTAAGAATSATSTPATSTPAAATPTTSTPTAAAPTLTLSTLPGEIVAVSDTNNYGSSGTETMTESAPDGSGRRVLLTSSSATTGLGLLAVSPNGTQIAYFSATAKAAHIDVMDLATRKVTSPYTLKGSTAFIAGISWTADGDHLVFGSNIRPGHTPATESALYQIGADGTGLTRLTAFDDAGSPTVAPDGDLVYVTSSTFSRTSGYEKSTLWLAGPTGAGPQALLSSRYFIAQPAVSPDGQAVVFSVTSNVTTSHIDSVGITGQGLTALTAAVKNRSDILPTWSPDGNEISFLSSRAGRYETSRTNQLMDAYVMTAGGTEVTPLRTFTGSRKSMVLLAWAP